MLSPGLSQANHDVPNRAKPDDLVAGGEVEKPKTEHGLLGRRIPLSRRRIPVAVHPIDGGLRIVASVKEVKEPQRLDRRRLEIDLADGGKAGRDSPIRASIAA